MAFYISSILTAMFVGFIADACGRRPILVILYIINVIGFICNLVSAYTLSYTWLLIGRLIAGYINSLKK
jgi:predicted MFS family arabinose efflux permease